jgi:PAS domain S-box-containing protein
MNKPLRIVHLEDLDSDAKLVERELKKGKIHFEYLHIETKQDFKKALQEFNPDVVLSDHSLPSFTSREALEMVKEQGDHIPFIIITGTMSEEFAVSMMRDGAYDYILKDRMQRLPGTVMNAVEKIYAQRERENQEKKFRALIENSHEGIVLHNENFDLIYKSPSVRKIAGYDENLVSGKKIFEQCHPDDQEKIKPVLEKLYATHNVPHHITFRLKHKRGHYIWIEATFTNMLKDENVRAYVTNFRDVSTKKEAEEQLLKSEASLRTIFENTPTSYVLIDKEFNIISFNRLAATNYKKELNITLKEGINLVNAMPNKRRGTTQRIFESVLKGEKVSYETSFPTGKDGMAWYNVNMFSTHNEKNPAFGLVISSEDITERKSIELERNKMTAAILKHNKDLEQFAYIISHNLRAPVANIMGLSNIIKDHASMSPEDFKKCMDGLFLSVKKLDNIIIDLNFILEARREINESKEMVSFSGIINDVKTSISDLIQRENIIINTNFSVNKLFTIRTYLYSIFFNLLNNSIKYRRTDVQTNIEVHSKRIDKKVIITFKDNGLGIDMSTNGDKLFGLYRKFHPHIEGKGMGLYMVKTQVEILGGSIRVASEVNKGTEFSIAFDE